MVQEAVIHEMQVTRKVEIFHRATLLINSAFPQQSGSQLTAMWKDCGKYETQVPRLFEFYKRFQEDVDPPIMLCEVARRYTW